MQQPDNTSSRNLRRELTIFFVVVAALGMANGMWETSFNNFLNDTFSISAKARGQLEFPREFPGFLVAIMGGLLFFFTETKLGIFSSLAIALGIIGVAQFGSNYTSMIAFMVLWSIGTHMMMPVNGTIALSLAPPNQRAAQMGKIGAIGLSAMVFGCALVWIGLEYGRIGYRAIFLIAACAALIASIFVSRISPLPKRSGQRPKLVLKRRYSLFYILNIFSGARKQVFVTFGPWVLIKVFHEPAPTIAKIWIVAAIIGIFFQPQIGRLIDRLGERTILMTDALLLIGICLGYGFAEHLPLARPVHLAYICYTLDHVLFASSMARTTYLDKISENESDIHASLSLGITIDHAVSMSIPILGGLIWTQYGYSYVFVWAAAIALCNMVAASFIRSPRREIAEPYLPSELTRSK